LIRNLFDDIRALKYKGLSGFKGYYVEYSEWFNKLNLDKDISLKVLDIGSDLFNTFYNYLKFKGFNISYYEGYDVNYHTIIRNGRKIIDKENLTIELFNKKLSLGFNLIKIDCEGCEYDFLNIMGFKKWIKYSIAIHNFKGLEYRFNFWKYELKNYGFKLAYVTRDKLEYVYIKN